MAKENAMGINDEESGNDDGLVNYEPPVSH